MISSSAHSSQYMCLNNPMTSINISYSNAQLRCLAESASLQLGLPLINIDNADKPDSQNSLKSTDYSLHFSLDGLSLVSNTKNSHGAIRCDFAAGSNRHRRNFGGGNGQMIAKAVGVSGKFYPLVLDLTAGMGADSFILASLGCRLKLLERNPIVYRLLQDGLSRAATAGRDEPALAEIIGRIKLLEGESSTHLKGLQAIDYPDIIYLDPMFPTRKKSAQVKKDMQALHSIVGADEDADILLEKALSKAKYRVVVKRPAYSEFLANTKPSYSLEGKSTRYDIFALQKIPK